MLKRSLIVAAALVFLGVLPARATIADRGASGQGTSTDANYNSATTVNGIAVTPFFNTNAATLYDIFQIPSDFTSGVSYILTFSDLSSGYGVFYCGNGSNNFAISADSTPVPLTGPCTTGDVPVNDPFVSASEVGNVSTISFLGGAGAPSTFYFWTNDANLLSIQAAPSTAAPEPSTLLLLPLGFAALLLYRRRLSTP